MRRSFVLEPTQIDDFALAVNHDPSITLYLTGVQVALDSRPTLDRFRLLHLEPEDRARLAVGENHLAVQVRGRGFVQVIPALTLPNRPKK